MGRRLRCSWRWALPLPSMPAGGFMPESATDSRTVPTASNGWVLYDGECAFCTRWVGFWSGVLRRHGFATGELQAPWVADQLRMAPEELMHDIRLLTRAGGVVSGADVYLYVWRR